MSRVVREEELVKGDLGEVVGVWELRVEVVGRNCIGSDEVCCLSVEWVWDWHWDYQGVICCRMMGWIFVL